MCCRYLLRFEWDAEESGEADLISRRAEAVSAAERATNMIARTQQTIEEDESLAASMQTVLMEAHKEEHLQKSLVTKLDQESK